MHILSKEIDRTLEYNYSQYHSLSRLRPFFLFFKLNIIKIKL